MFVSCGLSSKVPQESLKTRSRLLDLGVVDSAGAVRFVQTLNRLHV